MFLTRSEYDRGVNTFSPEGRLFQVEYAIEAIKLGTTAIGVKTSDGVVLAAEKRIPSPLMISTSMEKIYQIDKHITCACSGLIADSRELVEKARQEAKNYWFMYGKPMSVEGVTQAVSNLALRFGDDDAKGSRMSRPFGVALLFAGWDENGPQLYHMDPSGTFIDCQAKAIGAASEGAEQTLKEQYSESIGVGGAQKLGLDILKQVMEEKISSTNVEIAIISKPDPDKQGKCVELLGKDKIETMLQEL